MAHERKSTVPVGQLIELDDDPRVPCEWFIYGHVGMVDAQAKVMEYEERCGRARPRLGAIMHGQARWYPRSDVGDGKAGRVFRYLDDPHTSEGAFKTTRVTTEEATIAAEQEALALALRAAHVQRFVWELYPEGLNVRAECGELGEVQRVEWTMTGLSAPVGMTLGAGMQPEAAPQPDPTDRAVWAQLYGHRFAAWQSAQKDLAAQRANGGVAAKAAPPATRKPAGSLPLFELQTIEPPPRRAARQEAPPAAGWLTGWLRRLLGTEAVWASVDEAARRLARMSAEPGWAPRLVVRDHKTEAVAAAMVDRETARLLLTLDAPISVCLYKRAAALCEGVGDHGLAVAITWEGLRAPTLTPVQRAELEGVRALNLRKQGHSLYSFGHR